MALTLSLRSRDREVSTSVGTSDEGWQKDAEVWANVMRNRGRWVTSPGPLKDLYKDCAQQLTYWGIDLEALREMRGERLVEVSLPAGDDPTSMAIRSLPWEFLISASLTGEPNTREAPLVIRHLAPADEQSGTRSGPVSQAAPPAALFVQSAPGRLSKYYQFDSEQRLMVDAFAGQLHVDIRKNPTLPELALAAADGRPVVVHVTGIDNRQAAHLLGMATSTMPPGFCMKSPDGEALPKTAQEIAAALTLKGQPPLLAAFNMYYSAEIAAAAVAAGIGTAIGFLGEIDDATAEVFFTALYRAWAPHVRQGQGPLQAVYHAFSTLINDAMYLKHVEGAPIVLWSAHSHIHDAIAAPAPVTPQPPAAAPIVVRRLSLADVRRLISPYVEFPKTLNYCELHNGGSVFTKPAEIGLRSHHPHPVQGLDVEVAMDVGSARYTFAQSCLVEQANYPIERVHLSLTSEMARTLRERVQTNVTVTFRYCGADFYRATKQVGLSATDEWQTNLPWLPSFVLPRDPAVVDLVRAAQPFVAALSDSTENGFDNYLRLKGAGDARDQAIVDNQVRALWWAVRHRFRLSYLAAPPTDTSDVQRIRTPSAILKSRAGTCLDVALMFAACLAAIDLHAVVFVFKGHALPGYFRRPQGHTQFRGLLPSNFAPDASRDTDKKLKSQPWILERDGLSQIVDLMTSGELVPVEAVMLTEHGGFETATTRALARMQSHQDEFEGVYDITLARERGVTPLPIAGLL